MKKSIFLAASLLALNLTPVLGQSSFVGGPATVTYSNQQNPSSPPALTKFNLDFPGGTPAQLVKAIERAMGKPLNAIIPDEDADTKLPPFKLSDITFQQLSDTMRAGSAKTEIVNMRQPNGINYNISIETGYYFLTTDDRVTDNSVWFFHATKRHEQPSVEKVCRFYQLALYLDRGFTVDDITTAIQTGWKMAGVNPPPELNYHKETKLLIAYGDPGPLQTIQDVLQTLPASSMNHNEIDSMKSQIKDLQDQVGALKREILDASGPGRRPPPPEEKSGK